MSAKTKKRSSKRANTAASKPAAETSFGAGKRGARYNAEQKAKVVDFVNEYNAKHGRGGQSQAAQKFGLSVLTVASWLRSPYVEGSKGLVSKSASLPAGVNAKLATLIEVSDQLRKLEAEAAKLRAKYDTLRASIQSIL